jgi:hypothetical protein
MVSTELSSEPLEADELRALAGLWRASLDLDDGKQSFTCALGVFGKLRVFGDLPLLAQVDSCRWDASSVGSAGPGSVSINLQIGPWTLTGGGERNGLRCSFVSGSVFEGSFDDPVYVGSFKIALASAEVGDEELPALEERHRERLNLRPAPPSKFRRDSFAGQWRLLLALEGEAPCIRDVELKKDLRTFSNEGKPTLAGSWGMWDSTSKENGWEWSAQKKSGTHLWLRVDRDKSSSTLRGIADLPVRESFSLYGVPVLDSPEAEFAARIDAGATTDRVDGRVYFGTTGMGGAWALGGNFSLIRRGLSQ